jgi:drug/metabolite transporter (DMT)-like permease
MWEGFLFALAAMLLNSAAGLLQSAAAQRRDSRHPLLTRPRYLGGLAVDALGWVCTVVALRHMPVFAVQAVLGGAIAVTAIATRLLHGEALRPAERAAVGACLLGLALVAGSVGRGRPEPATPSTILLLFVAAGVLAALLGLLLATYRARPAALAVIAGLAFGGTSLAVRAAQLQDDTLTGAGGLATQPSTYLVLGFWAIGLTSYIRALKLGRLPEVTALLLVTEVVVPGLVGIGLLGDSVRAGWEPALFAGLLLASTGFTVFAHRSDPLRERPHDHTVHTGL